MDQRLQDVGSQDFGVVQRNQVLRNTYALLGLSMIPTVVGAYLGTQLGVVRSGMGGSLLFMAVAFGLIFAIQKFRNSSVGVALLLAFTFVMGVGLANILTWTLQFSNGATIIAMAAAGTGTIFIGMATLATVIKRDLSSMGKFLFIGLLLLVVASVANIFLATPALILTVAVIGCGLFSAYLLYDINRVVRGGETNYISATLSIYLDIYNIFVFLLQILGIFGGDRD